MSDTSRKSEGKFDDGKDLFDFLPARPASEEVERPESGSPDDELQEQVLEALKTVYDPEIPSTSSTSASSTSSRSRRAAPSMSR